MFSSSYSESASKIKQFKPKHDHIHIKISYKSTNLFDLNFSFHMRVCQFAAHRLLATEESKKSPFWTSCVYMGRKKISILIENEINNHQIYPCLLFDRIF